MFTGQCLNSYNEILHVRAISRVSFKLIDFYWLIAVNCFVFDGMLASMMNKVIIFLDTAAEKSPIVALTKQRIG